MAEGPESFSIERRGHSGYGRPLKRVSQGFEKELLAQVQRLEAENRYLKNCRPWFWKTSSASAKMQVIQELRPEILLKIMLSVAHWSGSTFYDEVKWMKKWNKYTSAKEKSKQFLKNGDDYRRITAELKNRKIFCNHKVVYRLMKELGLACRVRMNKYRSYKGEIGTCAKSAGEKL